MPETKNNNSLDGIGRNLIPFFIHEKFKEGIFEGDFDAYVLMVDFSGFTALTESLLKNNRQQGAETLYQIINGYFAPIVQVVYQNKGFITHFPGDAISAIFMVKKDKKEAAENAIQTALQILNLSISHSIQTVSKGNFVIPIKLGLSKGPVSWLISGDAKIIQEKAKVFTFRGAGMQTAVDALKKAIPHHLVLAPSVKEFIASKDLNTFEKDGYHFLKAKDKQVVPEEKTKLQPQPLSKTLLRSFVPDEVQQFNPKGEFRTIKACFISFKGIETNQTLSTFFSVIMKHLLQNGGYPKEIEFGDKGAVIMVLFGVPITKSNDHERVINFLLNLREDLGNYPSLAKLKWKAGISEGEVFTGFIGSRLRMQLGALGNAVNIAARIMSKAKWGQILCSELLGAEEKFELELYKKLKFKGFSLRLDIQEIIGRK